jgi:hypothetical protein
MVALSVDPAEQLRVEKTLLLKAERDIEDGWKRLRSQQRLLADLQAAGHDSREAQWLVELLRQTLVEWEQHRVLIEERISCLERQNLTGGS